MAEFTDMPRLAYRDYERHEVLLRWGTFWVIQGHTAWARDPANGLPGAFGFERKADGLLYWFTDARAAFAFKMRWL